MADRAAKDALFDGLASVAKALGSGRRAAIVDVLAQGERSVEELAAEICQSVANTSQHLQLLLRSGLVTTRRDGNRVFYALTSERVGELWALIGQVAADHVAEMDRLAQTYLGDRDRLASMTQAELRARLRAGTVVVLDVRPETEYDAGHIRGARSIPVDDLRRRLRELPRDAEIVAYCRGPYCVYADDAVRLLRRRGFRAHRLEAGYPQWARAGWPTSGAPSRRAGGTANRS